MSYNSNDNKFQLHDLLIENNTNGVNSDNYYLNCFSFQALLVLYDSDDKSVVSKRLFISARLVFLDFCQNFLKFYQSTRLVTEILILKSQTRTWV